MSPYPANARKIRPAKPAMPRAGWVSSNAIAHSPDKKDVDGGGRADRVKGPAYRPHAVELHQDSAGASLRGEHRRAGGSLHRKSIDLVEEVAHVGRDQGDGAFIQRGPGGKRRLSQQRANPGLCGPGSGREGAQSSREP